MASLEGKNLGPYRVIEQIGSGGMAKIFKAYQPSMERYVALKVLPEHFADDPRFTERFDREARVIARLEHKNILPVHDFGEQDGITYLVMRYLEGGTLKKVLSSGRLTLKDIDDIMTQVCEALDYAHRKGVVHRDVKPSNIMIDNEGSAYLTDFGIAKVLEGTVELTETGAALGTPAYMSPEQGLGHKVDSRSDIYSLGVILYEMLVGHVPFQADTPMAVALAHIHEPLPLPRKINPEIPEAIEAVVIKALAKEPDDRYQTASEMAVALKTAIRESKVAAYESTLLNLVTQPGFSLRAPTEVRPQVAEAPVEAKAPAIREALRKLPLRTIGIVLGAVVVLAVIIYAGSLLVGRLKERAEAQPTQAAEVAPTKAETVREPIKIIVPPGSGQASADDPTLHDAFNAPAFDGSLNPHLWELSDVEGCEVFQQDGVLVTTNQEQSSPSGCELMFGLGLPGSDLPSLEAQMYVSSESRGDAYKNFLNLTMGSERSAICSIGHQAEFTGAMFNVNSPDETLYQAQQPLEFDRWYTLRLQVDPGTMTFSCLVDGRPIGAYTPEDPAELRAATFVGLMGVERAINTVATIFVDNFRIIPPGAGQVFVDDPTLYDSFDNPGFDGTLNPLLWDLTGEEGCEVFQQDGVLVTTNQEQSSPFVCGLWFGLEAPGSDLPSLEAQMYVSSDSHGIASKNSLNLATELDGRGRHAECSIGYEQGGDPQVGFGVFDERSDAPYGELYYAGGQSLEFDRWYTLRLQVDPGTMTFSCLVDDQIIGSYTAEDPAELQTATFWGNMDIQRAENTVATIFVDNFRIIPPGAGQVFVDDPTLYDSFDDPAFDGGVNLNLWAPSDEEGCIVFQQDGVLVTTNQEMPNLFGCALWLGLEAPGSDLPSLEAQMNVSSDSHGGFYKNYLELATDLEGQWWSASCAFAHHPDFLGAEFEVYDRRLGGAPEDALSRARQPLEYDRWYTLRLQVDPGTMTFSCLVDGQPIGSYTPEDPAELQAATFAGLMGPVRAENTVATIFVDNFRVIPPGLVVTGRAPDAPLPGCFPPPEGMVGWWPGDGHDRDLAASHYGRLENQVRFAQGMVGQAFQFPSSSSGSGAYVIAENIAERIDFQGITLEAWVQLSSGPVGRIERFVTFGDETAVLRHGGDGMLHFYMSIDGEIREVYVPGILQKGGWYHVAGTYDGNFMRLYLDGVEVGSHPVRGDITRTNTSLWIGDGGEYLFGLIDEVSIYARALSPDEIRAIFEAGKLGKCKP